MIHTVNFLPFYIKKEDAHIIVKQQRTMLGIMLMAGAIALGCIQWFITPRLVEMYQEFAIPLPFITQISPPVTYTVLTLIVVSSLNALLSRPDYTELNTKLKKYKAGEMVMTSEVVNSKRSLWALVVVGLLIGWIVVSVILPIYSLTSAI